MPTFAFDARDARGRPQHGTSEAPSAATLATDLRKRGWLVLSVRAAADASASGGRSWNPLDWLPPRSVDVELSLQQMAVMLRSGLALLTTLKTVAEQANRASMRRVWEDVARRIQEGASLADAMSQHRCFPHLTLQLVRVGEQTGTLEPVLVRAAEAIERRRGLATALLTAMAYPALVLVAAIGVAAYMVFEVIPKLGQFLASLGRRLPAMTQLLVDVSVGVRDHALFVLIGLFAVAGTFIALYLWPPARLVIDRTLLRVPVFGRVLRLAGTALFARSLGMLVGSGVTLLEALRTVEHLYRNRHIALQVSTARVAVLNGGTLADALGDRTAFMPMLARMVAVGESAGTLEEVLEENAKFSEAQLQRTIRWLSLMIEPAIIVLVGGIVGFVYISFFMALFAAAGGWLADINEGHRPCVSAGINENDGMTASTTIFDVFAWCVRAIRDGELIRRESSKDKEFHFQNWFKKRLAKTSFNFEQGGRNSYPDFTVVQVTDGYELKGLAYPGRDASFDSNSQVPTGFHNGRTIYYVFGRYPKKPDGNQYPVIDLVLCHGDFLNADHDYVHKNKSVKGFGSYGDIMIRDRKMYVLPTPFHLVEGVAHRRTLVLPADVEAEKGFVEVGKLMRVEAKELVIAYSFDLRTNLLVPQKVPNPDAGKQHVFRAWRLTGEEAEPVSMRKIDLKKLQPEPDDDDADE